MSAPFSTVLYVADRYRRGCPSNRAGRRAGYGLTAKDAIAACDPWANQAPWFRRVTRSILVTDSVALDSDDEAHVYAALGIDSDPDPKRLATAVFAALDGAVVQGTIR